MILKLGNIKLKNGIMIFFKNEIEKERALKSFYNAGLKRIRF